MIVFNTAAEPWEEPNEEPRIHWIELLEHEVHSSTPNTFVSFLDEQKPGLYALSDEQARGNDFVSN